MDLRTPNMAGFQLLDLQDYPGQGSAYVGILDAFLESKGLCSAEKWRQWCSEVVPLLVADKYCFTNEEGIHSKIQVANYSGESLKGKTLLWCLNGQQGNLTLPDGEGLVDVGTVNISLNTYKQAAKLQLQLQVEGTEYRNTYDLWVYPAKQKLKKKGIIITREMTDEISEKLENGARVLLMPDSTTLCVGGLFHR